MLVQTIYSNKQEIIFCMPMERTEAMSYLKEILSLCADMSPISVSFEHSKSEDNSPSYRLHIKGAIQDTDKEKVKRSPKNTI
jgi:hypothetical protein